MYLLVCKVLLKAAYSAQASTYVLDLRLTCRMHARVTACTHSTRSLALSHSLPGGPRQGATRGGMHGHSLC